MAIKWMTAGESHGPALVGIISGFPAGLEIDFGFVNSELHRRQRGIGRSERQKIESDTAEFLSGIRHGITTGSPIAVRIENKDHRNWLDVMSVKPLEVSGDPIRKTYPRPGHADLAGILKWGFDDARNVLERASGRTTAMTVAIGALAKLYLGNFDTYVGSRLIQYGPELLVDGETIQMTSLDIEDRPGKLESLKDLTESQIAKITRVVKNARETGNTVGGVVQVISAYVPPGLGSTALPDERLDARLAGAMMGVPGIKAVEIGAGIEQARTGGREAHDEFSIAINPDRKSWYSRKTNFAGGIEGGITNGEPVSMKAWMKPLSTINPPHMSIDPETRQPVEPESTERTDVSAVESVAVVLESVAALEIASAHNEKFSGDSMDATYNNYDIFRKSIDF